MSSIEHQVDKLTGHYESVKLQHDDLNAYIVEQYKKYDEDEHVQQLKKRKLALKDEMESTLKRINTLKAEINES